MKQILIAFALTLTTGLSSMAGQLSFMTSKGQTSIADNAEIKTVWTTLEGKKMGLSITDKRGRVCYVSPEAFPNVDLANLALNLKKPDVLFVCKVDLVDFPQDGVSSSSSTVWIAVQ